MKSIILSLFGLVLCATVSIAQPLDTVTVRIKGMRCDDCAHKVMNKVLENKGVVDIWFNIERRTATVSYDKTKTTAEEIWAPFRGKRFNPTPYNPNDVIKRGFGQRMIELQTDADAQRVVAALEGKLGIDSLAPHLNKKYLFIRYDANRTSRAEIRSLLLAAGFTPSNYYTGPKVSYANFTFPTDKVQSVSIDDLLAIDGVEDACINRERGTVAITYFNDETTAEKLKEDVFAIQNSDLSIHN
jgi:copper chaperone CopZ